MHDVVECVGTSMVMLLSAMLENEGKRFSITFNGVGATGYIIGVVVRKNMPLRYIVKYDNTHWAAKYFIDPSDNDFVIL